MLAIGSEVSQSMLAIGSEVPQSKWIFMSETQKVPKNKLTFMSEGTSDDMFMHTNDTWYLRIAFTCMSWGTSDNMYLYGRIPDLTLTCTSESTIDCVNLHVIGNPRSHLC